MLYRGYNDVVLLIENIEVNSITSILCVSNSRLNAIINDEKADTKISLPDYITRKAFSLLCRYYGYATIDIDEENVTELLICCICLNEPNLLSKCKNFILSHLNNKLVIDIINQIMYLPKEYLNDLKTAVCDYICLNCTSILDNENLFGKLYLDHINFIVNLENLLIPSEQYLLDKILKHYNYGIENIENKNEEYNETIEKLNWKKININEIGDKDFGLIDIETIYKRIYQQPIKRKYGRIPKTGYRILNEMILNGFKDIDKIKDMLCILILLYL